jgi:membrane fusion protein (multidrug efflux system)
MARWFRHLGAGVVAALAVGCGTSEGAPSATPPPPVEVAVVTVASGPVSLTADLPGRVVASRVAEVRARAAGIVLERTFDEGSDVRKGQVLYRIDPAPLAAAVKSAEASLARAQAARTVAETRASRFEQLVATHAVSELDAADALAARDQARAEVAAAEAALATARLNLGYATVTAPISGRIGRAEVTEGALVGQGQPTLLATVQQLDPVRVDLTQSTAELQALRAKAAKGELALVGEGRAKVTILREDGAAFPGELLFTDVTVDPATSAVLLRAEVPNPDGALLPGEFVRARLDQAVVQDGITVPQQAVSRTAEGARVVVVDAEDKAAVRPVQVGAAVGDAWLVTSGLQAGERVVVEGLQRVQPGSVVKPVPWE